MEKTLTQGPGKFIRKPASHGSIHSSVLRRQRQGLEPQYGAKIVQAFLQIHSASLLASIFNIFPFLPFSLAHH